MSTQQRIQGIHAALRLGATMVHLSVRKERGKARLKVEPAGQDSKHRLDPAVLVAREDAADWLRFVLSESTLIRKPNGEHRAYTFRWTPAGKRYGVHTLYLQPKQPPRFGRSRSIMVGTWPYVFTAMSMPQPH